MYFSYQRWTTCKWTFPGIRTTCNVYVQFSYPKSPDEFLTLPKSILKSLVFLSFLHNRKLPIATLSILERPNIRLLWTFRHHFGSHQPFRRHHQFFGKQPNIITYLCIVYVYIYILYIFILCSYLEYGIPPEAPAHWTRNAPSGAPSRARPWLPSSLAKLVNISPITMVYRWYIYIYYISN